MKAKSIDQRMREIIEDLLAGGIPLDLAMVEFEKKYIDGGLGLAKQASGRPNITKAAQLLGVHRNTLHNKLRMRGAR